MAVTQPTLIPSHLEALRAIARLICQRSGQRQMLSEVLQILSCSLDLTCGTIMLLSADGAELVVEEASGADRQTQESVRYRLGEGIVGEVVQSGKPLIVPCVALESRFRNRIFARDQSTLERTSFLCVPIKVGEEVIGTLSADLRRGPEELLARASAALEVVASMIAYDSQARREEKHHSEALEEENLRLRQALGESFQPRNLIGHSGAMQELSRKIFQVASSDATVLIRGESGTGKEMVAAAIHYASPRASKPFIKVNCAAFSETLLESELFGHEKGAFTGAIQQHAGPIEQAQGGTLFLDEIGEFSLSLQVKLLRVLQEREFHRVGGTGSIKADVRIIAATNANLEEAIQKGTFRLDLFYRVAVFPIYLPPLRERKEDLMMLAEHFAQRYGSRLGKEIRRFSTPAINTLLSYHWPGNVRELENCIEHAVILSADGVIHSHHLPASLQKPSDSESTTLGALDLRVRSLERDMISDALKRTDNKVAAAAELLGITPRILRYKLRKLDLSDPR